MATNLAIDDELLAEARRVGGLKTKKATVTQALNEYIQRRKQQQIVRLFGKIKLLQSLPSERDPRLQHRLPALRGRAKAQSSDPYNGR